jgi:DNA invertase Pin-like site-specific DNA recombinase
MAKPDRHPVAYIRRSSSHEQGGAGDVSRATQEEAVRSLAHRDGHNGDTTVYVDWGRSGRGDLISRRTAYAAMLADVAGGRVSTIYCYALDRLNRDVLEHARLMRAVRDHKVTIVTQMEGEISEADPARWLMVQTFATQAEYVTRVYSQRQQENIRRRRERGDYVGAAPFGYRLAKEDGRVVLVANPEQPARPLLDAMAEAGNNVAEAVRLLNDRGVPSRYGKRWSPAALVRVLRGLGALPPVRRRARRTRTGKLNPPSPLSRLVVCHCGQVMTPTDKRKELYCWVGARDGLDRHGRYLARQRHVWEALRAELGQLSKIPIGRAETADLAERRQRLERRRGLLGIALADESIDPAEYRSRLDAIKRELDVLREAEDEEWVVGPRRKAIDWDGDPAELGARLHRYVAAVHVGPDMRPASIEWRLPGMGKAVAS